MENTEEIMQILERFTRLKQKEIPKELDDYLQYVAKTGDTIFKWPTLKYLFREKFLSVIKHFHDTSPRVDDLPQYPNVDPFNYETLKSALLERLELFNAAPFTIQRLCELLIDPRKQYSRIDKFMRALEKNILVVSTVEPGRKRDESENGDSLDSVVNGDLSLDVNVDIDMENESLFNIDLKNKLPQVSIHQSQKILQSQNQQQSSSNLVRTSDDEFLPNAKKQKMEDEKISEIQSSEKNNETIEKQFDTDNILSEESSHVVNTSETENEKIDPSKETNEQNEPITSSIDSNEENKIELDQAVTEKKTELVTTTKIVDSQNQKCTDLTNKNSEENESSVDEVTNSKPTIDPENEKIDLEKKENTEECQATESILASEDEIKTTNDVAEKNETSTKFETEKKIVEESLKENLSKNEETIYKECDPSIINEQNQDSDKENVSEQTNTENQENIEEKNEKNTQKKEEIFNTEEVTKEKSENVIELELPTTSVLQTDQPMEENAETIVTVNNISLTIPDNSVSVDEVIMGDGAEMATDSVEPIKDESASMEIDDTSQEAMDQ